MNNILLSYKQQLRDICLIFTKQLDLYISLSNDLIKAEQTKTGDERLASRCFFVSAFYEAQTAEPIRSVSELYDKMILSDTYQYTPELNKVAEDCIAVMKTINTFYYEILPAHINKIQSHLENSSAIPYVVLTGIVSGIDALKKQLKKYS